MYNYQKIRKLREIKQNGNKALTVSRIASEIGISLKAYENYENGVNNPTVDKLEKIALYYGKDMNYFFDNWTSSTSTTNTVIESTGTSDLMKDKYIAQLEESLRRSMEENDRKQDIISAFQSGKIKIIEPETTGKVVSDGKCG